MASKTINPTRMELTRLKGRLRTAVRGHRLLKDKRDELMRQFFLIVRENKELRAKVEQGIAEANRAMTVASSVMSPEMLQQALLYPKQSATLDMTFQNIMSVSVPVYEFHTKTRTPRPFTPTASRRRPASWTMRWARWPPYFRICLRWRRPKRRRSCSPPRSRRPAAASMRWNMS